MTLKVSVYRKELKKCHDILKAMSGEDFFSTPEKELPPENREEKFRIHSQKAYAALLEATPAKAVIFRTRGKSDKTRLSRRKIYELVASEMKKEFGDRYIVTSRKVNLILASITYGKEEGEFFKKCRENSARYIYELGIIPEVKKRLRKKGMSASYIQKELNLTRKEYYVFMKELCRRSFLRGCVYLPSNSPIAIFFRKSFAWNWKKSAVRPRKGIGTIKPRVKKGTNKPETTSKRSERRIRYNIPFKLLAELKGVLKAKRAAEIASDRMRDDPKRARGESK